MKIAKTKPENIFASAKTKAVCTASTSYIPAAQDLVFANRKKGKSKRFFVCK